MKKANNWYIHKPCKKLAVYDLGGNIGLRCFYCNCAILTWEEIQTKDKLVSNNLIN
jgi:hypothetical protein